MFYIPNYFSIFLTCIQSIKTIFNKKWTFKLIFVKLDQIVERITVQNARLKILRSRGILFKISIDKSAFKGDNKQVITYSVGKATTGIRITAAK